ncbi:MAG: M48 family metalloprotease [Candidatus Eremiobacteraeota bacterium]|nr:M48 family metalloprotease [Candidatus Eremiobacteraeota bacterium]MBC5804468.1 M48 family metalloprotease [Candidatus Eremiobacteraeota bacterium]MBC5821225.1 M48 family metalloprotease [Candidatus Eremiobacteraeota bacterium]
MRRFLIGAGAGLTLGYAFVRTNEALGELRRPAAPLEPNAARYGRLRRGLMLAGIIRSVAALGAAAYGLGPRLEPPAGERETRVRRMTLVAAALAASTLVDVPADFVEGLALERRYGLTKQTQGAWLGDRLKGLGVSLAVGVPLAELLVASIARAPRRWPLIATAGAFPLLVLANVVAPAFIAPLFNRFDVLEGDLAGDIRALASRYGAGDATILRMDMSRQTEKANAYVTGLFGTKRIVVGDTLLDHFEPRETLFVVAHELGHYVMGDVWRAVGIGTAASALIFFGGQRLAPPTAGASLATTAGLARLLFAISLLGLAAEPLLAFFSRSRECAADAFAVAASGEPAAGAAAFRRLRERNQAEDEQPKWMEVLFASHPSLRSRIARLETLGT